MGFIGIELFQATRRLSKQICRRLFSEEDDFDAILNRVVSILDERVSRTKGLNMNNTRMIQGFLCHRAQ